jgi:hypothetical protein
MATANFRDSILLLGASGRTGVCVLRYLCSASAPVIACVRRADRIPREPRLAAAEVAIVNLEQPGALAPLMERAAHVLYLAGSERKGLSPGAWQLEVESLSTCIELAQRSALPGRLIYAGHSAAERAGSVTWSESRWRELKREAEQLITGSNLNYFILRTGRVTDEVRDPPPVSVSQTSPCAPEAELPCNVLAFLLTGVTLAGATLRSRVNVQVDPRGLGLQEAVQAFGRLRTDAADPGNDGMGPLRATVMRR